MSGPVTVNGVVLLAAPSGEYDRRLVILTAERGKITAFARGARKPNSQLLAASNPFVFAKFEVYEGRDAYNLYRAEITHSFAELACEMPGVYYGFYFLEFADYYGREGLESTEMVNLLYVALRALENSRIPDLLIRSVYELKLMTVNGEYPQLDTCSFCMSRENLTAFSISSSGVCCSACAAKAGDAFRISPSLLYTMHYVIRQPVGKLYTFTLSDEVLQEFAVFMERYRACYVEKTFKSLEILHMMC